MADRLEPRTKWVHVVRWIRADGRNAEQRYFSRAHNARAYRAKLAGSGIPARIYATRVDEWREVR
jgi:hypothetical protein